MSLPKQRHPEYVSMDALREDQFGISGSDHSVSTTRKDIRWEKMWSTTNTEYGRFCPVDLVPVPRMNTWTTTNEDYGSRTSDSNASQPDQPEASVDENKDPIVEQSNDKTFEKWEQRPPILTVLPGQRIPGHRLLGSSHQSPGGTKNADEHVVSKPAGTLVTSGPARDFMENTCPRLWENVESLRSEQVSKNTQDTSDTIPEIYQKEINKKLVQTEAIPESVANEAFSKRVTTKKSVPLCTLLQGFQQRAANENIPPERVARKNNPECLIQNAIIGYHPKDDIGSRSTPTRKLSCADVANATWDNWTTSNEGYGKFRPHTPVEAKYRKMWSSGNQTSYRSPNGQVNSRDRFNPMAYQISEEPVSTKPADRVEQYSHQYRSTRRRTSTLLRTSPEGGHTGGKSHMTNETANQCVPAGPAKDYMQNTCSRLWKNVEALNK